jgi:hypothetical protein
MNTPDNLFDKHRLGERRTLTVGSKDVQSRFYLVPKAMLYALYYSLFIGSFGLSYIR